MRRFKGVKRLYINIDWDKMLYENEHVSRRNVECMKIQWNPFKDWEQGFNSDCFHCQSYEVCNNIFWNEKYHLENHFKEIVIPTDKKLWWGDEQVEINDIE